MIKKIYRGRAERRLIELLAKADNPVSDDQAVRDLREARDLLQRNRALNAKYDLVLRGYEREAMPHECATN